MSMSTGCSCFDPAGLELTFQFVDFSLPVDCQIES